MTKKIRNYRCGGFLFLSIFRDFQSGFSTLAGISAMVFFLVSCSHPPKKAKPQWAELDGGQDLECAPWPQIDGGGGGDDGLDDMPIISDVVFRGAIVGEGKTQDGVSGEIVAAATGVDRKGQPAMFVSPVMRDSSTEPVMTSYKGAAPRLVRGSCPLAQLPQGLRAEWGVAGPVDGADGCLMVVRDSDDVPVLILVSSVGTVKPVSLAGMEKAFTGGQAVAPAQFSDGTVVLVAEPEAGRSDEQLIPWIKIGVDIGTKNFPEKITESWVLKLKTTAPIESVRALPTPGGIYVAAVTGDSMTGEGNIEAYFYRFNVRDAVWGKVIRLPHIHLGEPALLMDGAAPSAAVTLMVPKWVDRESTLGTYRLSPEGLVPMPNRGIFPSISVIVDAVANKSGVAMMVRSRVKDQWRYKLCEVK